MRFKLLLLFLLPILIYATPGFHTPWGKDTDLVYTADTGKFPNPAQVTTQKLEPGRVGCEEAPSAKAKLNFPEKAVYTPQKIEQEPLRHSLAVRTARQIILFHQNVLSPVDGPRSHFRPSSSSYMLQSMQKHGFIEGFLMGCDRLMRENSDDWVYRKVEENGKLFKYDPVR